MAFAEILKGIQAQKVASYAAANPVKAYTTNTGAAAGLAKQKAASDAAAGKNVINTASSVPQSPAAASVGMAQSDMDKLVEYARAAKEQYNQTGTFNGKTEGQNLAAVANQPGNTSGAKALPFINAAGETDYRIVGGSYTPNAEKPQTGTSDVTSSGSSDVTSSGSSGNSINQSNLQSEQAALIDQITKLQYDSQVQKLREQRDTALQGLNKSETQTKQSAYENRNQADAQNIQSARRLREIMAEQGLLNSGDNLTNQSNLNTSGQNVMGQINQKEASTLQDILEQRGTINTNAAADELALLQGLQAQQAQNKLDLGYKVNDAAYRDKAFDWTKQMDTSNLTGQYTNPYTGQTQQTLQSKQLDRNNFESDRSYELAKSTQDWNQTFQKEQYSDQKAQQLWENTFKDKSFTQSMNEAAASRGLQWSSLNQRDKEFVADLAYKEKTFAADQEQRKIENSKSGATSSANYDKDISRIADIYVTAEQYGSPAKVNNPTAMRNAIIALGMDDEATDRYLTIYGLPVN